MFQFLNLDNASKAEKEILHTILFKDGHHQRKEFFKDLRPEYESSLDASTENEIQCGALFGGRPHSGTPRHDVDNSDTSSAADFPIEGEAGMPNDIASHSMRSHGDQHMRSYYTSAPLPQNPHAGGAHQLGHHPQLSMYHHPQMMQNPAGQFLPQFPVIPVPYGAPAPHNIGLPAHLPPQQFMPAEVPDIHMHQKIHDMHHSPGGGAPHSSKYRPNKNDRRPRRADEAYTSHHTHPQPQFYSNMSYGPPMYYTTQSVTNMTGTPLIMPGSGAPTPMYHQGHYPPQMYPPMLGNEQHMQQQQHQPGSSSVHQRTERMDSPKADINMFAGANGDSAGFSSGEHEHHQHHQPQRECAETEGSDGRSSRNSQTHQQPAAELKIDTRPRFEEPQSAPSRGKSPMPQPKEENETSTSAATMPLPPAQQSQPENRWGEVLNGNLTDSLPSASSVQQKEKPQPEQLPETNLVQETVNVPSKPESQPQGPKTWSSTVNGGNSQPQATSLPPATAPAMAATIQARTKRETKDSSEFPDLSNATAIASSTGPMPAAAPTPLSSTTATSAPAAAPPAAASASQSKMSWANIASRQTAGGGPPNGTSNTISLGQSHEYAKKQYAAGEGAGVGSSDSGSGGAMSKHALENDSSVGLYSSTQEPVYDNDPIALRLGEYLSTYVLDHHTFSLTPRGLSNQNNFCYINATLQALVACPPFVNLFRSLYDIIGKKPCKSTPIIQSMFDFIMEFEPITRLTQQRNRKTSDAFYVGANFEASGIRKVLGLLDGATFKVEGRQQDAEEFLSHLLNALHDEMIKVIKWSEMQKEKSAQSKSGQSGSKEAVPQPLPAATDEEDDSEQWQVMGPKNKGCMTRKTSLSKSPISEMFVGQMCSALNRANSLKSTTLQPFFTLQLDIQSENIHSIRDALEGISVKEEVTGCVASNGVETEAWKQMSLEVLPSILILHMKRFVFDTAVNTIRKLDKRVDFSIDLEIAKDLLSVNSKNKYTSKQRLYKLFAVVYHDGEEAIKGHYVADTFHPSGGSLWGQFGWIRYDDTAVKGVNENQILNPQSPRVPYLLYYRRVDTLQTKKDRS